MHEVQGVREVRRGDWRQAVVESEKLNKVTTSELACNVVAELKEKGLSVGCAESCTGGLLAGVITSVSGASGVFECGIVSYSERIKCELLGLTQDFIDKHGVVSKEVALAMAKSVIKLSGADVGVGITGIAGPNGGTEEQPVGTIYVSVLYGDRNITKNLKLYENGEFDRNTNRELTVIHALKSICEILKG